MNLSCISWKFLHLFVSTCYETHFTLFLSSSFYKDSFGNKIKIGHVGISSDKNADLSIILSKSCLKNNY